jgi:nucleoside-diphosphate-sugar epimerase
MPIILLTGATGFLGSHLLKRFINEGYEVIVLKRSFSNINRIENVIKQVKVYDIDLVDTQSIFINHKIDIVVHVATNYGRNIKKNSELVLNNIYFSILLLELSLQYGVKKFINTDTMLKHNVNGYALSKHQFIQWGKVLAMDKKIALINLKIEFIYGPNDNENKLVTKIIRDLLNNVEFISLTDGSQKRDLVYVDDVVNAYLCVIKNAISKGFIEFQVGSGCSISIKQVVFQIKKNVEKKCLKKVKTKMLFGDLSKRQFEPSEIMTNIEGLKSIGWEPIINIFDGLDITIGAELERYHKINI